MILSYENEEKIKLLDTIISLYPIEQLKNMVDQEMTVAKLKGEDARSSVLLQFIEEHRKQGAEIYRLQNEVHNLRTDMQLLIKVIDQTMFTYNYDFNTLKQRNNI